MGSSKMRHVGSLVGLVNQNVKQAVLCCRCGCNGVYPSSGFLRTSSKCGHIACLSCVKAHMKRFAAIADTSSCASVSARESRQVAHKEPRRHDSAPCLHPECWEVYDLSLD